MLERTKIIAAETFKLPKDVVLGEAVITFIGRYSVIIENYRGILIYDDHVVKLQTHNCKLTICGKRLHIEYYSHEEMKITGQIHSLEFGD